MKILLTGILFFSSFGAFAVDCECYAEFDVIEGMHKGETLSSQESIHLGSFKNINYYEIPLAKRKCSSEVKKEFGSKIASSNLECGN